MATINPQQIRNLEKEMLACKDWVYFYRNYTTIGKIDKRTDEQLREYEAHCRTCGATPDRRHLWINGPSLAGMDAAFQFEANGDPFGTPSIKIALL